MMIVMRLFLAIHVGLYRLTGGRFGGRFNKGDILLLTTIGRKTGNKRTVPLMYLRDGNNYLISGSAGGGPKHPGWYWNAIQGTNPVQIQVMDKVMKVAVKEASGEQRDQLYQRFIAMNEQFAGYEKQTERKIPVLILTPQS